MTKHQAWRKAQDRWGTAEHLGFTRIRQKSTVDRFEVGYFKAHSSEPPVIVGSGPSWEVAFARADSAEQRS